TIEGMAARVLTETRYDTFALAGLSMGGIVAMEIVRQAPERVERLALLDTNHLPDTPERRDGRAQQIEWVKVGKLTSVMRDLKPFYVAPAHRGDPVLDAIFMGMAETLGPDVFIRQTRALMARGDASDVLRGYRGKTLLLCGEFDEPCPPSRHAEMAELLDRCDLIVVEGAGHVTTLEAPDAVTRALQNWLQ
ncbi:MAG: alpha/beta hydrolase, partial [Pseudomonadota bacterium]